MKFKTCVHVPPWNYLLNLTLICPPMLGNVAGWNPPSSPSPFQVRWNIWNPHASWDYRGEHIITWGSGGRSCRWVGNNRLRALWMLLCTKSTTPDASVSLCFNTLFSRREHSHHAWTVTKPPMKTQSELPLWKPFFFPWLTIEIAQWVEKFSSCPCAEHSGLVRFPLLQEINQFHHVLLCSYLKDRNAYYWSQSPY